MIIQKGGFRPKTVESCKNDAINDVELEHRLLS